MHILEKRKDQYVVQDDSGDVLTFPKTMYYTVKLEAFDGNRIIYRFNADNEVIETYDDGLFNCIRGAAVMQLDAGNQIAAAIIQHKTTGSLEKFSELFNKEINQKNRLYLVKYMLEDYRDRLKISDHFVDIDNGIFRIDDNAAAYSQLSPNSFGYKYLCIGAEPGGILANSEVQTPIGKFDLDSTGMQLIAKVLFLLNPNPDDAVFMRQLADHVRVHVKKTAASNELALWGK